MEECDLLYGATMQQKGVTKLVSVKLEEAIDFSNENRKGGILDGIFYTNKRKISWKVN